MKRTQLGRVYSWQVSLCNFLFLFLFFVFSSSLMGRGMKPPKLSGSQILIAVETRQLRYLTAVSYVLAGMWAKCDPRFDSIILPFSRSMTRSSFYKTF